VKKIVLGLLTVGFFVGCGSNINQESIQKQQQQADKAWHELDSDSNKSNVKDVKKK